MYTLSPHLYACLLSMRLTGLNRVDAADRFKWSTD